MSYAEGTSVSVDKSRAELDAILAKAGASQRGVMTDDERGFAQIVFSLQGRHVRLRIPLPQFGKFGTAVRRVNANKSVEYERTPEQQRQAYEQACRQRWRQMVLLVKAKLEAVEIGISSVEREFLADIFLPDGRTIHQALVNDIQEAYASGKMPPLLGSGT